MLADNEAAIPLSDVEERPADGIKDAPLRDRLRDDLLHGNGAYRRAGNGCEIVPTGPEAGR